MLFEIWNLNGSHESVLLVYVIGTVILLWKGLVKAEFACGNSFSMTEHVADMLEPSIEAYFIMYLC